jgi:type II restriction enzyme
MFSNGTTWHKESVKGPNSPLSSSDAEFLLGLCNELKTDLNSSHESSFASAPGNQIMDYLGLDSITVSQKVDIWLRIPIAMNPNGEKLGFSVKSNIGAASTLFNASKLTNFTFEVDSFSQAQLDLLLSSEPIQKRVRGFIDSGGSLRFKEIASEVFTYNLELVDSQLKQDLAAVLVDYFSSDRSTLLDIIQSLSSIDKDPYYESKLEYRLRKFLLSVALGMTPGTRWDTRTLAFGGYIVVKDEGEVVCIPAMNSDALAEFLLSKSYLDTPSTTRHEFGQLINDGSNKTFRLNLQIRFRN